MGAIFVNQLGAWMTSEAGDKRHAQARETLEKRAQARKKYLATADQNPTKEEQQFNLLMKGF